MSDDQSYWRIKHAFEQLIELTGTQRANKLAQLQRDQPELASALVSRLARLEGLHEPVDAADAASKPSIAGYTLLQLAGAGGMGKVWLAQRDGEPEQKLALKQLHAEQPDAELLRRFAQERRVLARLNHPHIAALVDAGVDDRGKPYLVTAWVDGERIDRWCELNQANRRERVRLIRDIAAALSYAHAQLIVHRDLKPANILVDRGGQVRLLDFGIAKRLEPEVSEPLVTAIPIMTLRYAAPEQVAGESIGPACDLYALGVLLFELISGRSPYPDCSHPSALAYAIVNTDPSAPQFSGPADAGSGNQRDLQAIVLNLLRKRPQDRYGSAKELVGDLDRWLAGAPVHARSEERGYLLRRWLGRWKFALAVAALLPVFLAWHLWRVDQQLKQTELQRDRARAVADFFVQLFAQAAPGEAREGEISARTLLDRSVQQLTAPASGLNSSTRSLLQWVSGRVYNNLGMVREAQPLLAEAIRQMQQQKPLPIDELVEAYRTHASVLYQLDRAQESLTASLAAVALLEQQNQTQSERYAGILQNAAIAAANFDQSQADALFERALAVLERNQASMRRAYVLLLLNLGGDRSAQYKHEQASDYFARAAAAIKLLQPKDVDLELTVQRANLESQLELGVAEEQRSRLKRTLESNLKTALAHYGAQHLESAFWHELAGIAALDSMNRPAAAVEFAQAEAIAMQLFDSPGHDHRVRFGLNLALFALADGDAESARAQLDTLAKLSRADGEYRGQIDLLRQFLACASTGPKPALTMLPNWQRQLVQKYGCD